MARKLVNWEKTSALCPSPDDLGEPRQEQRRASRSTRRRARGRSGPGWQAAWRSRSRASRTWIFDRPSPSRPTRAEQRRAVVVAQLVVQLALGRLELAVERLLGLGGEILRHLLLRAAQDEGAERRGRATATASGSALRAADPSAPKTRRRAEHAGVQELEQAPQLAQVVLDRRAAERQAMVGRAAGAPPWPTRCARS